MSMVYTEWHFYCYAECCAIHADMLSVVNAECHIFIVIQSVICAECRGALNSPAKTCLDILTSSKKNLMRSSLTARGIFPTVRMRELFGLWRSPTILYSFIWCQCYKTLSGITVAGKSYWRGRLGTIDLLVLTSLYQLLFISKILFTFFKKYNLP